MAFLSVFAANFAIGGVFSKFFVVFRILIGLLGELLSVSVADFSLCPHSCVPVFSRPARGVHFAETRTARVDCSEPPPPNNGGSANCVEVGVIRCRDVWVWMCLQFSNICGRHTFPRNSGQARGVCQHLEPAPGYGSESDGAIAVDAADALLRSGRSSGRFCRLAVGAGRGEAAR